MKKIIIYSISSLSLIIMIVGLVVYKNNSNMVASPTTDYDYVYDILDNIDIPVVNNEDVKLIRPYVDNSVKVVKDFYDYKDKEDVQQNSIIYYENTYIQSTGISYGNEKAFDVVAILPGEVTEILTDELVGNSITIKHADDTYSVYQSITDITVSKGDHVEQGDKLAKTSTSNISKELNNHLYFELIIDGISVNPEEYYDKAL